MQAPLANDKKRVKVYELRDNDWFDRGTGFCTGQVINVRNFFCCFARMASAELASDRRANNCDDPQDEPRIYVESEDQPDRMLLETRIVKDDGYQKQQGT